MQRIGIYGGSFNPVHFGHVGLAKWVIEHTDLDELWLLVSPNNPLKPAGILAPEQERLAGVRSLCRVRLIRPTRCVNCKKRTRTTSSRSSSERITSLFSINGGNMNISSLTSASSSILEICQAKPVCQRSGLYSVSVAV